MVKGNPGPAICNRGRINQSKGINNKEFKVEGF